MLSDEELDLWAFDGDAQKNVGALIAQAREANRLRSANAALRPFAVHKPGCLATVPVNVYAEKWKYGPCECGLDAALKAAEGEGSR